MGEEQGYNGWSNYETWAMALWMDNDQGSYAITREMVNEAGLTCRHCGQPVEKVDEIWVHVGGNATACDQLSERADTAAPSIADAADALKDWQEELMPELEASVWSDLLTAAFGEVDWFEIAEAILSE